MWFVKVILLGAPRLGKTTALRRLTGEIKDISSSGEAEQSSTGTVESAPSVVIRNLSSTIAVVTPTEWAAINDLTEEASMLLQFFHNHVQEKKAKVAVNSLSLEGSAPTLQEVSPHSPVDSNTPDSQPKSSAPHSSTKSVGRHQPRAILAEVARLFRKAVGPKYWKDIKQFKDTVFMKMEDTKQEVEGRTDGKCW